MSELITTLILFIDETLLYWVPALMILGVYVKHCTKVPNYFIPLIEVAGGFVLGIAYGVALSLEAGGFVGGFLAIIQYGGQGALLGFVAMAMYDLVKGALKMILSRKEEKE